MNDAIEFTPIEQLVHRLGVGEGGAHELEAGGLLQQREARLLESDIVIVIDGVETDHIVAVRQQPARDVKTDEPRGAGDQDLHARLTDD